MTNQCHSHYTLLQPDVICRSNFLSQESKVRSSRTRVAFCCRIPQATVENDESWKHSSTSSQPFPAVTCSNAVIMLASFALGVRAASASSFASQGELQGYERLPVVRYEVKVVSDAAEPDASSVSSISNNTALHFVEGDNVSYCTAREFMQGQTTQNNECNAHEAYLDSVYRKLRHASLSQPKSLSDKNSRSQNLEGVTLEEGKDLGKPSQERGSVPFKLTIPLRVVSLRGSLPPIWLKDFLLSQGKRVKLSVEYQNSLNVIMSALRLAVERKDVKPNSILAADLVTIGDSWLPLAVTGGLIEPIKNVEQHEWFKRLDKNWQDFLRRDQDGRLNPQGLIWGVPYRWGSMVIAYKKDQFLKNNIPALEDWQDLWKPELKGQIAMVDAPREVVGAVLKSLGASYNTQDFDRDVEGGKEAVKQQFLALQKQVKVFDSVHYLKAFGSDDVWVAVGWSSDVIPVAKRMSNVRVVTPKSGVSLWADLWAIPAATSVPTKKFGSRGHAASPLIYQWFDFCLQPARSLPFKQGTFTGMSPSVFLKGEHGEEAEQQGRTIDALGKSMERPAMDTDMIEGMPPKSCLEKSEVLEPLSDKAAGEYQWLFSQAAEPQRPRNDLKDKVKGFFNMVDR